MNRKYRAQQLAGIELNESRRKVDEGLEQGINKIISWANKNIMQKFWTADQKAAKQKLTDRRVAAMYDDIARNNPEIMKMIKSNIDQYKIQKALAKAGFSADEIEPDGSGDQSYNVAARMHTVIQMLKQAHRDEKKAANDKKVMDIAKKHGYKSKKRTAMK